MKSVQKGFTMIELMIVTGNTNGTSTGQAVTITVTPTNTSAGTLTWSFSGTTSQVHAGNLSLRPS